MALEIEAPLKQLASRFSAGDPITLADLRALGVSSQLAYWYTKHGWLQRLGRGAFVRDSSQLDLRASLVALERAGGKFHVGGRTALDWRGIRHFVRQREPVTLFGSQPFTVPEWLSGRFNVVYRRKQLFRGKDAASLAVSRLEGDAAAPLASEPERAILELLSEVPQRQSVEEARLLMEGLQTLRPPMLQRLLASCVSVKTVRLFLNWSRELGLPHLEKLDERKFRKGSKSRHVYRTADSTLVLKP
jgi:Transcriptional regulator, AbiEi antitoxin, Type IV TA system/Transcriptional regulator, AbiEi antitoxin N-terminal domain